MPVATSRSESMWSPEWVSSRMGISGSRTASFRIFLPSTLACRSRISSVAVSTAVSATIHLDQDLVVLHLHLVDVHRRRGRQASRPAGLEVERRPVLRALDRAEVAVHLTLGQMLKRSA